MDGQGRGSLGFAKVESTQAQSGIINTTWYWQDFPHTGSVRFSQTRAANNCLIAESSTTPDAVTITHGNGARRVIPYVASSTQSKRDLDCSDMGTTVTTVSPPDDYGNSTTSTSTTQVKGGEQFITEQVMRYTQKTWPLSQLDKVTETKTVGTTKAAPRTMDYTYDANGLVETETKQKGKPALETITTYTRNGFGLVEQTSLTWLDPQKGASKTVQVATITYTANGRFPSKIKNALGHEEIKTFDPRNGAPVTHTDINSLSTSWQVDGFGRKLKQTTPDGTDIYTYQKQCSPNCPSGAVSVLVTESKRGVDRVAVPSLVFSDTAGHPVRSITWGFDGEMIGSDMIYDSRGRVFETYQPQFTKELTNGALTANLAVRNHYDDLNRIIQADTVDEAGKQYTTTTYRGLQIDFENPKGRTQTTKGQIKTDIRDVAGRLEQSIDANGGITKYEHDPYNNLTKTTDPKLNVVTILYDELGRRTDLYDPDLGWNHYQLNPLGQVIKQTSPTQRKKDAAQPSIAHSTTMVYDDLGRMTARNEFDLTARWVYDGANCVTNKSCGKLVESYTLNDKNKEQEKDNQQSHSYDSLGRPSTTRLQRDVLYTQRFEYDTWSRPLKESWQRGSESAKVFERRYNEWGYQHQLLKATGANSYAVLWQANKQDASQRLLNAELGNGRLVQRDYHASSGRLKSATLIGDNAKPLISENLTYDVLGNIDLRNQQWAAIDLARPADGFIEIFTYDKLNRLETASVTGYDSAKQTFTYDAIGNIKSKTGTGTGEYAYPDSGINSYDSDGASNNRPHAVKDIPGIGSFGYDANGNMAFGNGRAITWTSFDMPNKISEAALGLGISSSFTYGADHQRTKQIKTHPTGNSTVYYAGAMEVEIKGGTTTIKTYWPGGLGVEIDRPNEAAEWNWTHADRLGSVIAVTNAGGDLVERLAYDAWGKRRNLRGNSTDNNIDGQVDNKGFTGHEMLDKLDLVHMNGRIYDPLVARFMSADPIIQDPEHSQSYNRYSYVWNNPTNLTDPTGFVTATVSISATSAPNGVCPEGQQCAMGTNTKTGKEELYVITVNSVTITNEQGVSRSFEWTGGKNGQLVETKASAITSLVEKGDNWLHKAITGKSADNDTPSFGESVVKLLDPIRGATEASRSAQDGDYVGAGLIAVSIVVKPARILEKLEGALGSLGARLKNFLGLNPCKCFVAGTVIHTKRGLVPIEEIETGDLVAARSDETSETGYKQVVRLVRNGEKEIIRLRYRLPNGKMETLGVTEEHPFMLEGRRWINAGALKPGDKIMRLAGGVLTVVSMRHQVIKQHTFNFEVEGFHSYFAGVGGAWVHNSGPCDLVAKNAAALAKEGEMLGARGVQTSSKTIWKGEGKARIDVENPNPGQRPGQIHYQDNAGNKYLYDPASGSFPNAPNSVNRLLENSEFAKAIQKGLVKYLGQ